MNQTPESPATLERLAPVALPENITSVQPGGGFCFRLELAWGSWRRWYLKRFRPAHVRRMAQRLRGSAAGAPHEVLDPRDLKYCANRCTAQWDELDDPFRWRRRIPLARWGLAEAQIMGWPLLVLSVLPSLLVPRFWYAGFAPLAVLIWLLYFFRDPPRRIPEGQGLLVAPADGKVVEIVRLEHDEFIGGPAVRIGIFLSIFNVHINRAPIQSRVIALRYQRGEFLNALNPQSAVRNENMWIGLEEEAPPHRRLVVRQIAGAIARRIVCRLRPGETVTAGEQFGMIKLGSRTELIVPDEPGLEIITFLGQKIRAGATVLARYGGK